MRAAAALLLAGLALGPAAAGAYELDGSRWPGARTSFWVGLSGSSPSGVPWSQAFEEAADEWSALTPFQFDIVPSYASPCGSVAFRNGVDFGDDICGDAFGANTLAVTLQLFSGFEMLETDIVFNQPRWSWDVYDGPMQLFSEDFRRVALHELGHALGLAHEDDGPPTIMESFIGNRDALGSDDVAGVEALYGGCDDRPALGDETDLLGILRPSDCFLSELLPEEAGDTTLLDIYALSVGDGELSVQLDSDDFRPYLAVVPAEGAGGLGDALATDGNASSESARVELELEAGDYLVLANAYFPSSAGTYRLRAEFVPEPGAALSLLAAGAALARLRGRAGAAGRS